jgi:DNA-binding LacI/PurR family transcriptional regulator/DNA-binding transcriptional regulator YhcF (GntR family)
MQYESKPRKKYLSRAESLKHVEDEIRFRVANKIWLPNVMLPSRRALATEFGVDPHTIRRAIAPLLSEGILHADVGRGTFVGQRDESDAVTDCVSAFSPSRSAVNGFVRQLNTRFGPPISSIRGLGTLGIITVYDETRSSSDYVAGIGSREIVRSLERAFTEIGGKTVVYNLFRPDGSFMTVGTATKVLVRQGVDSIVVIGIDRDPVLGDVRLPRDYKKCIPVVHISGQGDLHSAVHVYYDNRQAGLQAAEHLISIGCRSIVCIAPFTVPWLEDRVDGARLAFTEAGLNPNDFLVYPPVQTIKQWSLSAQVESDAVIEEAFDLGLFTDGVIAPNDAVGYQIIRHAHLRGQKIGQDFALIGFDDIPNSSFAGLTSLRPPFEEMGREASSLLVRMIFGDNISLQLCLPSHLIVRNSTNSYTPKAL